MASDSETVKLLLEQITKLNHNLESATFATNNLTKQLTSQEIAASASGTTILTNSAEPRDSAPANSQRVLGYVNWNETHEVLKSQSLVKMSSIRASLERVLLNSEARTKQNKSNAVVGYGVQGGISGQFNTSIVGTRNLDRETRFPMDAVYINVESPAVKEEIDFMNKLNVPAPEGVVERFLNIIESEMHTCETFEKLHGLKWA